MAKVQRSVTLAAFAVLLSVFCACSDRPATAARATVETFYGALQSDNLPLMEDNLAQTASPQFRVRIEAVAADAQTSDDARRSVQLVRVDTPVITGGAARVRVVFADGQTDDVSLVSEGLRWKVLSSERLG
jgi:hypothetical protein